MRIVFVLLALTLAGCGVGTNPGTTNPIGTASTAASSTMPNVVGMRLSDAKKLLVAQGYNLAEQDSTGRGRQVLDVVNWVVDGQSPEAGASTTHGAQVTLRVHKPSDGAGDPSASPGVVPNVLCKDLQSAQDLLQAAGFHNLGSTDATGQNRHQIVDRNWIVVSQSPAAGERPDQAARITLGAVKFGEPTGASGCKS